MSDKHIDPKELRRPDLFQQQMIKLLSWVEKNIKTLLLLLAPLLLIVVAFFTWNYVGERNAETQRNELSSIDLLYDNEEEGVSKQREEVQKQIEQLMQSNPAALNPAMLGEKTAKAKIDPKAEKEKEAKIKDLEEKYRAIKADHSVSLAKFEEYSRKNSNHPTGWRAGLKAATILVEQKEYVKAIDLLTPVLEKAQNPVYQVQGRIYLASLLEETSKVDEAISQLDKVLAQKPQSEVASKVLFTKARMLSQTGKAEEASRVFDEVVNSYASTPEAEKARAARSMAR